MLFLETFSSPDHIIMVTSGVGHGQFLESADTLVQLRVTAGPACQRLIRGSASVTHALRIGESHQL